jgi:hypothetical protein
VLTGDVNNSCYYGFTVGQRYWCTRITSPTGRGSRARVLVLNGSRTLRKTSNMPNTCRLQGQVDASSVVSGSASRTSYNWRNSRELFPAGTLASLRAARAFWDNSVPGAAPEESLSNGPSCRDPASVISSDIALRSAARKTPKSALHELFRIVLVIVGPMAQARFGVHSASAGRCLANDTLDGDAMKTWLFGCGVCVIALGPMWAAPVSAGPISLDAMLTMQSSAYLGSHASTDSQAVSHNESLTPLDVQVLCRVDAGPNTFSQTQGKATATWQSVAAGDLLVDVSGDIAVGDDLLFGTAGIEFGGPNRAANAWTYTFIADTDGLYTMNAAMGQGTAFIFEWSEAGALIGGASLGVVGVPSTATVHESILSGHEYTAMISWNFGGIESSGQITTGFAQHFDVPGDFAWSFDTEPAPVPVPEPTTLMLSMTGMCMLMRRWLRRRD